MERYSKQLTSLISMFNDYVLLLLSTELFHQNKNTRYFDLENNDVSMIHCSHNSSFLMLITYVRHVN